VLTHEKTCGRGATHQQRSNPETAANPPDSPSLAAGGTVNAGGFANAVSDRVIAAM